MNAGVLTVAASPTATGWVLADSADVTRQYLRAVTCVSAADCWAVGYYSSSANFDQTLIEHWNGSVWQIVPSPNSSTTQHNQLLSVTCASTSDCWAVGAYRFFSGGTRYATLVEHWDGSAWSIFGAPISNFEFRGVTCVSTSDCWTVAVGHVGAPASLLIEHWNGTEWSSVPSPTAGSPELESVTCISTSNCWAVGRAGSPRQTHVEHWDGTSWEIVSSPNVATTRDNSLWGIACASASDCWATGYYTDNTATGHTLIERWDGVSWSLVSSPNPNSFDSFLFDVTCASGSDCWAVGNYSSDGFLYEGLIEHWNGSSWSIVPANININEDNYLDGVACFSTAQCWAVGKADEGRTLIERWNGIAWSRVDAPYANGGGGIDDYLVDVTCLSASNCWTVGTYHNASHAQTMSEHWDGNSWLIVPTRSTSSNHDNYLNGVTCLSATDCWAVGEAFTTDADQTLTEHWDGNSWSIVASANSNTMQDNYLTAIACTSTSDCWAVGAFNDGDSSQTLIEHWDGVSWSIVNSPNVSGQDNFLNGITCSSALQCWAVGNSNNANASQTLIELWDGTSWAIVNSPNPNTHNYLNDVSCPSASDCWAVGFDRMGSSPSQTLTERWNGASWSVVPSPSTSATQSNGLSSVTCASGSNCWAVGSYFASQELTLIEHWNGTSWSITASPNASVLNGNRLIGVACDSPLRCWAAGYYQTDSQAINQTLIEQFVAPPLTITSMNRPADGRIVIIGQTAPDFAINIDAAPELTTAFGFIGSAIADSTGAFQFEDLDAARFERRFYRASLR